MCYVSPTLRDDAVFAMKALTLNGLVLRLLKNSQKNNQKLVIAAINNDSRAINFASQQLCSDAIFLLEAANINGFIFLCGMGLIQTLLQLEGKLKNDIALEAMNNMLRRLKLLAKYEQETTLSEIRKIIPLLASELEITLREQNKPMFNLGNIHFKNL